MKGKGNSRGSHLLAHKLMISLLPSHTNSACGDDQSRFRSLTFHALVQLPVAVPVIKIRGTGRTGKKSQRVELSDSRTVGTSALTRFSAQCCSVPTARTTDDLSTSGKWPPSMRTLSRTFGSDTIASEWRRFGSRRRRSCPEVSHLDNVPSVLTEESLWHSRP